MNGTLKFEPDLDFQREAIASATGIFKGQEKLTGNFTVQALPEEFSASGTTAAYANELRLSPEQVAENVREVQMGNGLAPSDDESVRQMQFCVWMETGTGKTYVYLRTVFELNRLYGFTKFIVVVPSIAIKEGVMSSLALMKEHFAAQYGNPVYDAFAYDSGRLNEVRSFAVSDTIQIMVINIQSFIRSENVIHRENDKMMGRPIDFIAGCHPVVIVDEPQSVDSTEKSKAAMATLGPLCQLRYSATHRKKDVNVLIYRLDSIDAMEKKLVKEIEVAELTVADSHNTAYFRLVSVDNAGGAITARVEMDIDKGGKVARKTVKVRSGENLHKKSGMRDIYEGYIVDDIGCEKGGEYLTFTSKPEVLRIGGAAGNAEADALKKEQMRRTVEEHLRKELLLRAKGVKVLSLFFIDRVDCYRRYGEDGRAYNGKYAEWFEEIYAEMAVKPQFAALGLSAGDAAKVHNGYFSIDKKGRSVDTSESNDAGRANAERGYELIMKDKTRLLSFDEPVRFIFSHSALKEGWDNPNVFQICTLNEISSDMRRRQMIGRGLRICVNQSGERVREDGVNRLTVMANESFANFAENLQREIEEDTGITFGIVTRETFAHIPVFDTTGTRHPLGTEESGRVFDGLVACGYITPKGKVEDRLRAALKAKRVKVDEEFKPIKTAIVKELEKIVGGYAVKKPRKPHKLVLNKRRFLSPEFKNLWDKIKYKTSYRVSVDTEELVEKCVEAMKNRTKFVVTKPLFAYEKGSLRYGEDGVSVVDVKMGAQTAVELGEMPCPDIVGYLQNETALTRRTAARILLESGRAGDIRKNPQMFMEGAVKIVRGVLAQMMVAGIKYTRLPDADVWLQSLFEDADKAIIGYLDDARNLEATPNRGLYDCALFDSEVERKFAEDLDRSEDVKLFAKLPSWFTIPTPLGTYNPDWAVVLEKDGDERLYFVVETKGTGVEDDLPPEQRMKIKCGKEHFKAVGLSAHGDDYLGPVKTVADFRKIAFQ